MLRMKERERLLLDVRSEQGDDQVKNSCHKTALLNKHKMIPKQNKTKKCCALTLTGFVTRPIKKLVSLHGVLFHFTVANMIHILLKVNNIRAITGI